MTEYLTEQEQIQQLKHLARQYIPPILIGLLLAFGGTSGWQMVKKHQNRIRAEASMVYEEMLAAKDQHQSDNMIKAAKILIDKYSNTVYAAQGAFMLAQDAVRNGQLKNAEQALNTVLKKGRKTGLYDIALLRLARVKIAAGDTKMALKLLDALDPAFVGLANLVRGEALSAQHAPDAAVNAYRLALQELPSTGLLAALLQMKVDNFSEGSVHE